MKKYLKFLKEHWIFLSLLLGLFLLATYSYFNQGILHSLLNSDASSVINFVESFGFFAGLIFLILVVLEVVFAPIPPMIIYVAGGFIFGTFFGGVLALLGNLIGAGIDFLIARKFGRKFVIKKVPVKQRKKFDTFSKKYGNLAIFFLRLNPLTSSDLFSYIAGLTNMKMRNFLIATGAGLIPLVFIQTYFGGKIIQQSSFFSFLLIILSVFYLLIFIYLLFKSFNNSNVGAK